MFEYRHKPREKRIKEIIIGQGIVILAIVVISLCLIFWGLGYEINWKTLSIKHSGIIYLSYSPKDAKVMIDGKQYDQGSPFDIKKFAGNYDLVVEKDSYISWSQVAKVENDRVVSFRNISLFRENPKISEITDTDSINSINAPYDSLVSNPSGGLFASDYEIWIGNQLITRFSTPISGVIWYPGNEYLGFQQANQIRIIKKDGTNDNLLVTFGSGSKTKFIFSWDGASLLYRDGEKYYKADIN